MPTTRVELAATIRRLGCEIHWLDQKPESERSALDKAADLTRAITSYRSILAASVATQTEDGRGSE